MSAEVYHLGSLPGEEMNWSPFDNDMPPDMEDDLPPDMQQHSPPEPQEQFDQMPIIDEPPPDIPKPKRGRPAKPDAEERRQKKEDAELERILAKHDRENNKQEFVRKAPAPAKASGGSKKNKNIPKEDAEKHMGLILKVDKYRTSPRFAECLAQSRLPVSNVEHLSIEELEDLLTRINIVVSNRHARTGGVLGTTIVIGAGIVEGLPVTKRFANLDGYAAALAGNEEFHDLCEQLSIDHSIMEALSPEKRMLWCLGKTAMTVNGINKWKEAARNGQNEEPIVSPTDASHDISVRDL